MLFSKSITFGEEELGKVALATSKSSAQSTVESEFIEKLRNGNAQAFDTLVTRYSSDIYGLLLRITRDTEEASDLTQETFLRALKAISKFRGDSDLKTWLYRIAINQSKNRFRWWKTRKREKTVSIDAPIGDSEAVLSDMIPGKFSSPEEDTLEKERTSLLFEKLGELPEIFKEAVILCDIEGLKYEEIASTLEISIGTVKSRIARGREELRNRLSDI
ncbi:MAG: sigma-70 family RNA polymerase sigma factor [Acidobacteria bacterium]|nr:sigma-70 family RNA polymerase sigma factor [Acidobacteriota bacterium]